MDVLLEFTGSDLNSLFRSMLWSRRNTCQSCLARNCFWVFWHSDRWSRYGVFCSWSISWIVNRLRCKVCVFLGFSGRRLPIFDWLNRLWIAQLHVSSCLVPIINFLAAELHKLVLFFNCRLMISQPFAVYFI